MQINSINSNANVGNINSNKSTVDESINPNINKTNENNDLHNNDKKNYSHKDIKEATEILNKLLEKNKSHVEMERHDVFNDLMIKIVHDDTGEVIREVPPKKILDMVAKMCEMVGILVDEKA